MRRETAYEAMQELLIERRHAEAIQSLAADALLARIHPLRAALVLGTNPVASDVVAARADFRDEARFCPISLSALASALEPNRTTAKKISRAAELGTQDG